MKINYVTAQSVIYYWYIAEKHRSNIILPSSCTDMYFDLKQQLRKENGILLTKSEYQQ